MTIEEHTLAAIAANDWCRCFKCDRIVNETGDQCLKPAGTCTKWYDAYKGAMIALEKLEKQKPAGEPEEPDKSLDEAGEKYANKEYPDEPSCGQWGTGDYEPPVDMEYPREVAKDAFIVGAKWQKEQLLNEAVEGRIHAIGFHNAIYIKEPEWTEKLDKCEEGDKVRVIVLPKEEPNNG